MTSRTIKGQTCQEDPNKPGGNASKSIGVLINGNDNFLTDVIVFEYVGAPPGLLHGGRSTGPLRLLHEGGSRFFFCVLTCAQY